MKHSLKPPVLRKEGALRLHPSHQRPMRSTTIVVALLVLGLLLAWSLPPLPEARGIASYLPLHTLLETIAIIVAILVFTVGWSANGGKLSGNVVLLACAFLGVGLLDFSHVLSFAGMPEFVTPSSPEKAINFWLAARSLAAAALLVAAVTPWRPFASPATRYVLLATVLALVATTSWLFLFHNDLLPRTFVPGQGLTAFKIASEYAIIALNLAAALALWMRMHKPQPFNAAALFGAVCAMALSELFFTLYADVADIFNLLGHVYKVVSYLFIYHAIFVETIADPYRRLSASQSHLQATLDALPDLLFELGLDGRCHGCHSPRTGLSTSPDAAFLGKSLPDTLSPDAAQIVLKALREAQDSGHSNGEYEIERPQGKRWFEFSVVRKPVDAGQEPRFIVLSRDITERKQAEDALRIKDAAIESAINAIAMAGLDGKLFYVNEAFVVLWRLQGAEDAIGRSWLEIWDKPEESQGVMEALRREGRWQGELRAHRHDGSLLHLQLSSHMVLDAVGNPMCMMCSFADVSARKHAEEELKRERDFATSLVNTAPVIILLLDARGIIQHANPYFEQVTGYRLDEIKGKEWFATFLPARDRDRIRRLFLGANHEGPTRGSIYRIVTRSGEEREIEWNDQPLHDADGTVTGLLAIAQDVTALRKLNQELEQRVEQRTAVMRAALHEAERASAAKSEFLSRMSHELRTPLNAILGFGQLLESDPDHPLTATQVENAREILHAGNHLLELINEVLDLTRIERGRLELNLEAVVVAPLIEVCVAQFRPLAAARQIRFSVERCAPCAVQADRLRLLKVLINLLSNAVKYNRDGGEIRLSCMPSGENRLRISVRDSGRGIAAAALPRLFKPFERMESAYDGIAGAGIGLALAKMLVEAMHGDIGVDSVPGEGSTFWFELPLSEVKPEAASGGARAMGPPTPGGPRKLLYVEDNPANLKLVQKILATRKDFTLLDAVSGEAGLEIATKQHPDLILLDINLPGMDGFEALRRLRDNPATRDIPVIAVTANAMFSDIERGKAAGFSEYLTKPIDMARFFDLIDRCLPGRVEGDK